MKAVVAVIAIVAVLITVFLLIFRGGPELGAEKVFARACEGGMVIKSAGTRELLPAGTVGNLMGSKDPVLVELQKGLDSQSHARDLGRALRKLQESCGTAGISISNAEPQQVAALLWELRQQDELKSVSLNYTWVDDAFLAKFGQQFPGLEVLRIGSSKITAEHFPMMPKLRELDLVKTPVNNAGLARLLELPGLQSLMLEGTGITPTGVGALQNGGGHIRSITIANSRFNPAQIKSTGFLDWRRTRWPGSTLLLP